MAKKAAPKKSVKSSSDKKKELPILKIIIGITVLGIGGLLAYSTITYQNSSEEHVGFFVCNKENTVCEQSKHVHSDIELNVCGEDITFPKEKGRTDLQHTHKERNYIHWHARMNVDPTTKEPLDPSKLTVGAFLEQMEYIFPTACPENPRPTMTVSINQVPSDTGLQYIWNDGDKISIVYQ